MCIYVGIIFSLFLLQIKVLVEDIAAEIEGESVAEIMPQKFIKLVKILRHAAPSQVGELVKILIGTTYQDRVLPRKT